MPYKNTKPTNRLFKNAKIFRQYFLFFIPALILGTLIWTFFVDGKLYYCSDKIPVLDFIPPFVHGSQYGDYWIADPNVVWTIWFSMLVLIFILPFVFAKISKITMHKKVIIITCFFFSGIIIWVLSSNLRGWIAGYYTGFVQACRQLNGKELTYSNINSLNGNCYKKCTNGDCGTVGICEEKHIQQYKNLKAKCNDHQGNEPYDVLYDPDENGDYHPIDPYYRCIDDYLKANKHDLAISPMGTFSISQAGLDGAWVCRISTVNSKIRAVPAFQDD